MIKTSKEQILDYLKKQTAQGVAEVDTSSVAKALDMQRSNVSALLNQWVSEGVVRKTNTRPVYYSLVENQMEEDCFSKMVGYDGSLSNVIQLAKAAILYPVKGLNTLIVGNGGTGKSYLAYMMFEYAKRMGKIKKDAEFRRINCRHFVNNPQEISNLLFGTSDEGKRNLIEASNDSILFIDNVDVLDGQGIERLNDFIETGHYIGDDGTQRSAQNVMLIISMDRKANIDLLRAMSSKISVKIEMPSVKERPLDERFALINHFFLEEAVITKHDISIQPEVMYALMLAESSWSLRVLNGAIKVAVASAYLRSYDNVKETIHVVIGDFPSDIAEGLLQYRANQKALSEVIPANFEYTYSKDGTQANMDREWRDFYEYINRKIDALREENMTKEAIDAMLSSEINTLVASFKEEIQNVEMNIKQLSKVVDLKVIEIVTQFIEKSESILGVHYPNSVVYGLCLHLNALVNEKRASAYLNIDKVNEVMTHYEREYQLAEILSEDVKNVLGKKLTVDEKVMLAMFLINDEDKTDANHPQILFAMHGDTAASSIADVVNDLVQINNTYAYDMPLETDSETAYKELKQKIQEIDQGSGVIVIYDMGSLKTILSRITTELEIEIRTLYMPITLIGIDASRKASMDTDIDTVYHNVLSSVNKLRGDLNSSQIAIITLCHTGEGGAIEIKNYLQNHYRSDIKIYPLAISERKKLIREVQRIRRYYEVKAFVGTYDPKLFGIPFVPVSQIFENDPREFDDLILSNLQPKDLDFEQMVAYLGDELGVDKDKVRKTLPEVIENLDAIYGLGIDQKVGLFLHLGALINRLMHRVPLIQNPGSMDLWNFKQDKLIAIKDILKKTEQTFDVIIPDSEIVTIFEIVRKETDHE